jgi:hypothetical protein
MGFHSAGVASCLAVAMAKSSPSEAAPPFLVLSVGSNGASFLPTACPARLSRPSYLSGTSRRSAAIQKTECLPQPLMALGLSLTLLLHRLL